MNTQLISRIRPAWAIALLAGVLTFWGLTRSGYANTYYAEAAQAASRSWRAWFTNAIDTSGSVSLDKGPLPNMLMGLSGRLFGFSSFTMLMPEALCGVGSVLVLHGAVKRTLGPRAAILAALMLALTPIFVAMSRFDNPDALLVLLEVSAAWALVRALQSARTAYVLSCGALVGLAFNVKMLQAYLIVPGLAATLLIAGKGTLRRRLGQLLAGGASMLTVSFAWYGTMMLLPASDRPWVGDTTDNSWFSLIFGANGLSRVSGEGVGAGAGLGMGGDFGGTAGPLRLFNTIVGGQISWLLPLALVGLVLGLWTSRRLARTDLARSAYLMWGAWGVVSWIVFSFSKGIFHPYYTTALAPAVAVLAAGGLTLMWDRSRGSTAWAATLLAGMIATVVLSLVLLGRAGGYAPYLVSVVVGLAVVAAGCMLLTRAAPSTASMFGSGRVAGFAAITGLVAILAGPAAYSIATVGKSLNGGNPLAGPTSAYTALGASGMGAPRGGGQLNRGALLAGPPSGSPPPGLPVTGRPAGGLPPGVTPSGGGGQTGFAPARNGGSNGATGGLGGMNVSSRLVKYLEAHRDGATYLVAAVGSSTSASIALQSSGNVINMGGFMGSDPAPSLPKLRRLIDSGQLHYVLLSAQRGGVGGGVGGPGKGNAATSARDAWVRSNGKVVHVAGESSTGTGLTLYYFPA